MKKTIEIGPLAPRISEQLKFALPAAELEKLDGHVIALNRVYVHGLISEAEYARAGKRFFRKVQFAITRFEAAQPKAA